MSDGTVDRKTVEGQTTATGEQKETFGTGSAAQSEAGKKGAAITADGGHDEAVKRGIKAAITKGQNVNTDVSPAMAKDLKKEGYELPK